ncbi:sensor histidine kinase [Cohnella silvisoli]|uniref:histidine kinase n=1 Tax=Cohnella silvisoli TaxID=2873699 RepID=A0ABV1KM80_9BACL|nr:histidine kinase [Cohnella silvisoli]MCD9020490.1 hypothetical protein [Cohnella silvisoli]
MRFLKTHIPLLRTMLILITLLLFIGLALSAFQQRNDSSIQLRVDRWQWAPALNYEDNPSPADGWKTYMPGQVIPATIYWLRIPLPRVDWEDPYLRVLNVGSLKVYDGKQILFSYILSKHNNRINSAFHWKMVKVPLPLPDHLDLLVRYTSTHPVSAFVEIGDKSSLLTQTLHEDLDNLILGALLLFSGFIALGLYSTQRDRLYIYFALLAFAGGYAALVRNFLLQVIWNNPLLGYFQDACMPIGTFAFIGALEQVFPGVHRRTIRFLRWTMLSFSVLTFVSAVFSAHWYAFSMRFFAPLFIIVFVSVYWTIWSAYRNRKDLETIWIMAGFTSLATIASIHMYRFVLVSYLPIGFTDRMSWVYRLPVDLLFWGLFAFVICLIRVIMYRYTAMNRQLLEFNRSLENIVQTRTHQIQERTEQLELAHQRLAASMRENAEALAEAMILEERHRITGSIHDTVGHTLSATIIQLEAAKRLIPRDQALAGEKLDASQGLVRRGLEDIRQSVRLLREDAAYYDLPGSIGALIRETEQSSDCIVESHFGSLPPNLSILQKRVLFQTLQEGLSIGTKHGHGSPNRFLFIVKADSDAIRMQLIHQEHTYTSADIGFGLHAMTEHVSRLGGTIAVDTDSTGFVLNLTLPLAGVDHWVI